MGEDHLCFSLDFHHRDLVFNKLVHRKLSIFAQPSLTTLDPAPVALGSLSRHSHRFNDSQSPRGGGSCESNEEEGDALKEAGRCCRAACDRWQGAVTLDRIPSCFSAPKVNSVNFDGWLVRRTGFVAQPRRGTGVIRRGAYRWLQGRPGKALCLHPQNLAW